MVTSVRPRGLQNDHRGRPDPVGSASPLDGTANNHKCPVGCVGPPDSRLSSINSPCKQTSKVMANQNTTHYGPSRLQGLTHVLSALWSVCTSPDTGASLHLQAQKGITRQREDRESGPQTGSPPSRPEEEQRLRLWGPEPKQPLWG